MGWGRGSGTQREEGALGTAAAGANTPETQLLTVMQMVTSREAAADLHDNGRECHPPTAPPAFPAFGAGAGVLWTLGCWPSPNPRTFIETCDWEGGSHKFKKVS